MSKYNEYAKMVDEVAKKYFAPYLEAKSAFEAEDRAFKDKDRYAAHDRQYVVTGAEKELRYLNDKAKHAALKEKFHNAGRALQNGVSEISSIRKKLEKQLESDMRARPGDMDANAIELLKSGVLKPSEYQGLLNDFKGNPTMIRMIGNYAKQGAAEADKRGDQAARSALLGVEHESRQMDGGEYLERFGLLEDAYRRTANNPAMISYWDNLTAEVISSF